MRWFLLALALYVTATAHAQGSDSDTAFYRAWYQETALRDFDAASKGYAAIAATPGVPADLAVKAHLGRARCLMLTGHIDDAQAEFRTAAAADPSNAEAKAALTRAPSAQTEDKELVQSMNNLLTSASNGSASALEQLVLFGPRGIPYLREALRGRWPTRATAAARALALMGTTESLSVLAQSLSDPEVLSPSCVIAALDKLPATPPALDVFDAALSLKESQHRVEALSALGAGGRPNDPVAQSHFAAILTRCAHDSSADVRQAVVLGSWPAYGIRPLISELVKSPDAADRRAALGLIQHSAVDLFVDEIRTGLKDPSADVRLSAMFCLQSDRAGIVTLRRDAAVNGLGDSDVGVAMLAAQILKKIPTAVWNDAAATAVIRALRRTFVEPGTLALWSDVKELQKSQAFGSYLGGIPTTNFIDLYVAATTAKSEVGSAERAAIRGWIIENAFQPRAKEGHAEEIASKGFAAIPDADGRAAWLGYWLNWQLRADGVLALASASADPAVRRQSYRGLATAGNRGEKFATPPHLAEDIASTDDDLRSASLPLARFCPDSSLVRPLRAIHDSATGKARADALGALVVQHTRTLWRTFGAISSRATKTSGSKHAPPSSTFSVTTPSTISCALPSDCPSRGPRSPIPRCRWRRSHASSNRSPSIA